jgi:competence protein ComEA
MKRALMLAFALLASVAMMACAHAEHLAPATPVLVPEPGAVDLNRATASDLIALPGIGPAKAEAILAYRGKRGGFRRVEELRRVKGFGRKTVARLRPLVTVTPPPRR